MTNKTNRQILVHHVPVRFPVAGNLMENVESLRYIYDALLSINEPSDLPGDVVVNATLLNRMENNQDRATLVVELDSEDRCNQILRKAKKKHAQDKRFAYYITPNLEDSTPETYPTQMRKFKPLTMPKREKRKRSQRSTNTSLRKEIRRRRNQNKNTAGHRMLVPLRGREWNQKVVDPPKSRG